jgi:hypothetical protein
MSVWLSPTTMGTHVPLTPAHGPLLALASPPSATASCFELASVFCLVSGLASVFFPESPVPEWPASGVALEDELLQAITGRARAVANVKRKVVRMRGTLARFLGRIDTPSYV